MYCSHIGVMVFNATFNNISVIPLRSVLLVIKVNRNTRSIPQICRTLSHNVVSSTTLGLVWLSHVVIVVTK